MFKNVNYPIDPAGAGEMYCGNCLWDNVFIGGPMESLGARCLYGSPLSPFDPG